jgi:hypothetical protein
MIQGRVQRLGEKRKEPLKTRDSNSGVESQLHVIPPPLGRSICLLNPGFSFLPKVD